VSKHGAGRWIFDLDKYVLMIIEIKRFNRFLMISGELNTHRFLMIVDPRPNMDIDGDRRYPCTSS